MADLWTKMTQLHPPGATTQYASPSGSSGNDGSSGSRTNFATAWSRITAAGGGTVILGDGNYGTINVSGNFSNSSWAIIKAENRFGATVTAAHAGNGSYIGFWGLKSVDTGVDHNFPMDVGHHYAVWCCWAGGGTSGGVSVAGNFGYVNNLSICYNIAERCSWNFFGSGISLYQLSNYVGSTNHTWIAGYDNVLVGNICQDNFNGPEAVQSDGNGIILDDNWNTQTEYSVQPNVRYLGNFLLLGNISVYNGGVGLHNLSTDLVDYYFNTVANNGRMFGNAYPGDKSNTEGTGAGMDAVCGVYGERLTTRMNVVGNLVRENNSDSGWFERSTATNVQAAQNTFVYGNDDFGSRDRRSDGWNYFATNPPTLTPRLDTITQWMPDGGSSGAVERAQVLGSVLSALSIFPDLRGTDRPSNGLWTVGALELPVGGGTSPVANFTFAPISPKVGETVRVTDASANSPTSWSYNWGDGTSASTTQNPSHIYTVAGSYSITLTATNASGSSVKVLNVIVTTGSSTSQNRELVDFNVANRTGFPPSNYGRGWGHQEYLSPGALGGSSSVVSNRGRQTTGSGGTGYNSIVDDLQTNFAGDFDLYVDCIPGFTRSVEAYMSVSFCAGNNRSIWDWRLLDGYELRIYGLAAVPIKVHSTPSSNPASDTVVHDTTYNSWSAGDTIHIRIRRVGTNLRVYLWKNAEAQPDTPVTNITTSLWSGPAIALGTGTGGLTTPAMPAAGANSAGHFSGRMLLDGSPMVGCIVKVVNAYHPNWVYPGPIQDVLDTEGGASGSDVYVTTTDSSGDWSVTGINAAKTYMLKIFPPTTCAGYAEIPSAYVTGESGYIDTDSANFMSTRSNPAFNTYSIFAQGRFLFDMPVHVFPTVGGALLGSNGYSDLNVAFYTRDGFATSQGWKTGCEGTVPNGGDVRIGEWDNLLILTGDQIGGTGGPTSLPTVETSNPGYTGSGYVNMNLAGEGVRFTNLTAPSAGTFTVTFRYQNILATICELKVNGVVVNPSYTLPSTSTSFASSSWGSAGVQTQLQAGLNDVQLRYVSGGELHLDWVKVSGDVVTPPPPPTTNTLPIIASGNPGHLKSAIDHGNKTYVITYQMTGHNGTLIDATGIAVLPPGTAPSGGWRVITVGHGATGASDDAAPSLQVGSLRAQIGGNVGDIDALLNAGFVVVMADYEGMGGQSNWRHPYMYGISAGRSLIDAARACAGLPGAKINKRLASWGFSQGGHAALWAGELVNSAAYGTEFECVTVALDPVIPTEYVSDQWQSSMYYGLLNVYGQWVADSSLPLASVADGTAVSAMSSGSDYYGQGSLFTNPTTPSQWAAAFRKTDPGYRNGGRVLHWEAQYGIGAQSAYVNRAASFGTVLDHRIAYGSGHDSNFTQQVQGESLAWVNDEIPAP